MISKTEAYNTINSRGYIRFKLDENNESEYLNKLYSVKQALQDVEENNKNAYQNKIQIIENLKEEIKVFYNFMDEVDKSKETVISELNVYIENYIEPLNSLRIREEKLQLQVVPYITDGFVQRFKAWFSHEGRTKLAIEKQFNKELKDVSKEIKNLKVLKEKNPLNFENLEKEEEKLIIQNIDLELLNSLEEISTIQLEEFKNTVDISKNITINNRKKEFIRKILDYIEICNEYALIKDLNVEEHYKFKNTEYKLYLQKGYLDNDLNSTLKYLETVKSEKDFVGEQAANKLIDGIQECIDILENIINSEKNEIGSETKLA